MIDAVDLPLREHALQVGVQRAGGVEVVPERLLDDDACPALTLAFALEPDLADVGDDLGYALGGVAR
jgi:hypothetical protein